jgi:hypothetical protein
LQPGGHRFDPGQLHQNLGEGVKSMESILSLGGLLVPIVAIIVGGVVVVTTMILRHQERIAKIERGIDPDASGK